MLLVPCPWCGPRPEGEFVALGEAVPARPADPAALSDEAWVAAVVMRENRRGPHAERWWHQKSCGRIVTVTRDTLGHAFAPDGAAPEAAP